MENVTLLKKVSEMIEKKLPVFIRKTTLADDLSDVRDVVRTLNKIEKEKGSNLRFFTFRRGRGHRHGDRDWVSYLPLANAEHVAVYINRRIIYGVAK